MILLKREERDKSRERKLFETKKKNSLFFIYRSKRGRHSPDFFLHKKKLFSNVRAYCSSR